MVVIMFGMAITIISTITSSMRSPWNSLPSVPICCKFNWAFRWLGILLAVVIGLCALELRRELAGLKGSAQKGRKPMIRPVLFSPWSSQPLRMPCRLHPFISRKA